MKFELFRCCLGNGVTVCNRAVTEHGDYKTIAHISKTGNIKLYVSSDYIPPEAMKIIQADAERERKNFIEYWNRLSIYKKYEILLDALRWEDCKKLIDKEKSIESRVSEATKIYMDMH